MYMALALLPDLFLQGILGKMEHAESAFLILPSGTCGRYESKYEAVLGWVATVCAKIQDEPRTDFVLGFSLMLGVRTWYSEQLVIA